MEKKQIIFQVNLVLHSRVCHLSIHSPHTHWGFYEVSLFTLYLKSRVRFYTRFAKPSYTTANTKITGSGPLWVVVCQTKSVMFYLDNPNLPTSFWKLHCVYPLMTTKWLKERLLHEVIFSRETKALIQTGFRERQTLWLPLGYLEAAELLFFSHNCAAFHIEHFRYVFSCALFLKVRFPLPPMLQITVYLDAGYFLKEF